jgi:hypothetical protein
MRGVGGLLTAILLAGTVAAYSLGIATAGSESAAALALRHLQSAAARGDTAAAAVLVEYERFTAANGLSPEEAATRGGDVAEIASMGPLNIAARGLAPFSVRIDASADLSNRAKLAAYIATRTAALASLASEQPGRALTVSVGFQRQPLLSDVLDLARQYDASPDQVLMDAMIDGQRRLTHVFAGPAAEGLTARANKDVINDLGLAVIEMAQPLCGAAPEDIVWQVQSVRFHMRADAALAMADEPDVLLIDPLDDVVDAYGGMTVFVNVAAWPNATTALSEIESRMPADNICQEVK